MSNDRILEYLKEKECWARKKKHNFRPFNDVMYHYYEGLEEAFHDAFVHVKYDF